MDLRNSINKSLASIILAGALFANDANAGENYSAFTKKEELADIVKHSKRIGLEPELLMAVRMTENGSDKVAYGIIPQGSGRTSYDKDKSYSLKGETFIYKSEVEKQMCWAGWTIKKRLDEFSSLGANRTRYKDFVDYLGDKYAPQKVKNDPKNLNKNWKNNFRSFYTQFKKPNPSK